MGSRGEEVVTLGSQPTEVPVVIDNRSRKTL